MVALLLIVVWMFEDEEKTDRGGRRGSVETGSVACLVNRGRTSVLLGSAEGGISSVVEDIRRLPGHRARTRWRLERLAMLMN